MGAPLKISVVTVCFNVVKSIEETMLSVLNQTYPNIEYIIIDGGSTDGTVNIIKKYSDRLAYWISEPDKGIYDAMNKGIAAATGDYINFMNAGDSFFNEDVVSRVMPYLISRPVAAYGDIIRTYSSGEQACIKPLSLDKYETRMPMCHQALFINTPIHKKSLYDLSFRICADYNLIYHLLKRYKDRFIYIPLIICNYEGNGISQNLHQTLHRENYRIWGIENNTWEVAKREFLLIIWAIKEGILSLLPNRMVFKIRMWRKRRLRQ